MPEEEGDDDDVAWRLDRTTSAPPTGGVVDDATPFGSRSGSVLPMMPPGGAQ